MLEKMWVLEKNDTSNVKVDDYPCLKDFMEGMRTLTAIKWNGWETYVFKKAFITHRASNKQVAIRPKNQTDFYYKKITENSKKPSSPSEN